MPGALGDRFGAICPRFAHIRKVNPRGLTTDKGGREHTLTLAVLRRGITLGDVIPDRADGPGN